MKALTIWQPWAWLIVSGHKPLENRGWAPPSRFIGEPLAIHAGKTVDPCYVDIAADLGERMGIAVPELEDLPRGAIVGMAKLVGYVTDSDNPFFSGPVGWNLRHPLAIDPIPCRGAQGLWDVPPELAAQLDAKWRAHLAAPRHLISIGRDYARSIATVCEVAFPRAEYMVDTLFETTCPDCLQIVAENGART